MPKRLTWSALVSFVAYLGTDSALAREIAPELAAWESASKTNMILADLWEVVAQLNANVVGMASGKPANKAGHYPRPGCEQNIDQDDKRKIGSGALPPAELEQWFEERRREHERND